MDKKKLRLKIINVESFVTSLENDQKEEVKGGGDTRFCPSGQYSGCPCGSNYTDCLQFTCHTCTCQTLCHLC